jgi:hypothetical protein
MAGNVNTAPSKLSRLTTSFKGIFIHQHRTLADVSGQGGRPSLVPLTIKLVPGQTANAVEVHDSASPANVLWAVSPSGAAVGGSVMSVAHAKYSFAVDGGVTGLITPATDAVIPVNAIIIGGHINVTTAVTSLGAATLAVGTSAGSSATSILTATAKASLTLAALINSTATLAAPVKMSAAGAITVTVGSADLTAGVVEIFVFYITSST